MWNLRWNDCGKLRREGDPRRAKAEARRSEYAERDELIRELGFASYREYLDSDLWARIRASVLTGARGGRRACCMCPSLATQVHHDRYTRSNLAGASTKYLRPVCRACHNKVEFTRKKSKKLQPAVVRQRVAAKERRRKKLDRRRRGLDRQPDPELSVTKEFLELAKTF